MSWFLFCEVVQDWLEITVVEPNKRGPSLRNRLAGQARMYVRAFNREKLASENGVEYFLEVLKKEYLRDAPRVFMWRFTNFLKVRRHSDDILSWLYKYDLEFTRLMGAWKDLCPYVDPQSATTAKKIEINAWINQNFPENERPQSDQERIALYNERVIDPAHVAKFPFQELVKTLFMVIQSQLSSEQLRVLFTRQVYDGVKLTEYNMKWIETVFRDLLASPNASLDNPTIQRKRTTHSDPS